MAFFNPLKIKIQPTEREKNKRIQTRIQEAVQSGYWNTLNEDEREEFVFGCMLEEVDTSKTVATDVFIKKLQNRNSIKKAFFQKKNTFLVENTEGVLSTLASVLKP